MTLRECLNNHMYQKAKIGAESGFLFCDKITEETTDILTPAFCGAHRSLMRFRAAALRSKTATQKRVVNGCLS